MPRYDFICTHCNFETEEIVTYLNRSVPLDCPNCHTIGSMLRQIPTCHVRGEMFEVREIIRKKCGSTIVPEEMEAKHLQQIRTLGATPKSNSSPIKYKPSDL